MNRNISYERMSLFVYLYSTLTLTTILYNLISLHGFKDFYIQTSICNACYGLMLMLLSHDIVKKYKHHTVLRRWQLNLAKIVLFFMNKVDNSSNIRMVLTLLYCMILAFICSIINMRVRKEN